MLIPIRLLNLVLLHLETFYSQDVYTVSSVGDLEHFTVFVNDPGLEEIIFAELKEIIHQES